MSKFSCCCTFSKGLILYFLASLLYTHADIDIFLKHTSMNTIQQDIYNIEHDEKEESMKIIMMMLFRAEYKGTDTK